MKYLLPLLMLFPTTASADLIYALGNSLTVDAQPWRWADSAVAYCGIPMPDIVNNTPNACWAHNSTLDFRADLTATQYDKLVIQPHEGPQTFAEDVSAILTVAAYQPNADIVIHTGMLRLSAMESGGFAARAEYVDNLVNAVQSQHAGTVTHNYALHAFEQVRIDVDNGVGPATDLAQLYRDDIHASYDTFGAGGVRALVPGYHQGRNINEAMTRAALDLPQVTTDPYILGLTAVPEPSAFALMGLVGALVWFRKKLQR